MSGRFFAVAQAIAGDTKAGRYCILAGAGALAVPVQSESAFRRAVLDLGYPLPEKC